MKKQENTELDSSTEERLTETIGLGEDQKFRSANNGIVYTVISVEDEEIERGSGSTPEKAFVEASLYFMHEDEQGLLSRLKSHDYPTLRLDVWSTNKNSPVYAVSVDGKKNVTAAKDHGGPDEKRWSRKIKVKVADSKLYKGLSHPEYPENSLRYFIVKGSRVEMWEVSLISQRGEFFVVEHMSYNVEIFRDKHGNMKVPEFSTRRPQFEKFILELPEIQAIKRETLRPLVRYYLEEERRTKRLETRREHLPKKQGIVAFFTPGQKTGMILTATEEVRVHYSQIVGPDNKLKTLKAGDLVEFRELRKITSLREDLMKKSDRKLAIQTTRRNTSFKYEAIAVKVI